MELIRTPAGLSSTFSVLSKLKTKCSRSHTVQRGLCAENPLLRIYNHPETFAEDNENTSEDKY